MTVGDILKVIAPKFFNQEEEKTYVRFFKLQTEHNGLGCVYYGDLYADELNKIDYEDTKNYPILKFKVDWVKAEAPNEFDIFFIQEGSEDLLTK